MRLVYFPLTGNSSDGHAPDDLCAWPAPLPGVAIWSTSLVQPSASVRKFQASLSDAEHARAGRFGTPELRDRYIVGRGTLRRLLGQHLGVPADRVQIARGAHGRPFVAGADGFDFNVSHSAGVALFALTRGCRIGVDIEHRERQVNVEGIARKFMSDEERDTLQGLDVDARRVALLRFWTCKEAMSKATGDALSAPFRHLSVIAGDTLRLVAGPPPYSPKEWQLAPVAGPAGFLATVALWTGR